MTNDEAREERAFAFLIPDAEGSTYTDAAHLLADADEANLAAVIARAARGKTRKRSGHHSGLVRMRPSRLGGRAC